MKRSSSLTPQRRRPTDTVNHAGLSPSLWATPHTSNAATKRGRSASLDRPPSGNTSPNPTDDTGPSLDVAIHKILSREAQRATPGGSELSHLLATHTARPKSHQSQATSASSSSPTSAQKTAAVLAQVAALTQRQSTDRLTSTPTPNPPSRLHQDPVNPATSQHTQPVSLYPHNPSQHVPLVARTIAPTDVLSQAASWQAQHGAASASAFLHRSPVVAVGPSFAGPLHPFVGAVSAVPQGQSSVAPPHPPPSAPLPSTTSTPSAVSLSQTMPFSDANELVRQRRLAREASSAVPLSSDTTSTTSTTTSVPPSASAVTVNVNMSGMSVGRHSRRSRSVGSGDRSASTATPTPSSHKPSKHSSKKSSLSGKRSTPLPLRRSTKTPSRGSSKSVKVAFGSGTTTSSTTSTKRRTSRKAATPRQSSSSCSVTSVSANSRRKASTPSTAPPSSVTPSETTLTDSDMSLPPPSTSPTDPPSITGVKTVHVIPAVPFVPPPPPPSTATAAAVPTSQFDANVGTVTTEGKEESKEGPSTAPPTPPTTTATTATTTATTTSSKSTPSSRKPCSRSKRQSGECVGCAARDRRIDALSQSTTTRYQQQLSRHKKELAAVNKQWQQRLDDATAAFEKQLADSRKTHVEAQSVTAQTLDDLEDNHSQQVKHLTALLKEEGARLAAANRRATELTHQVEKLKSAPSLFKAAVVDNKEYERVLNALIVAEEGRAAAEAQTLTLSDSVKLERAEVCEVSAQLSDARSQLTSLQKEVDAAESRTRAAERRCRNQVEIVNQAKTYVSTTADRCVSMQMEIDRLEGLVFGRKKKPSTQRHPRQKKKQASHPTATATKDGRRVRTSVKPRLPTAAVKHARRGRSTRKKGSVSGGRKVLRRRSVSTVEFGSDSEAENGAHGDNSTFFKAELDRLAAISSQMEDTETAAVRVAAELVKQSSLQSYAAHRCYELAQSTVCPNPTPPGEVEAEAESETEADTGRPRQCVPVPQPPPQLLAQPSTSTASSVSQSVSQSVAVDRTADEPAHSDAESDLDSESSDASSVISIGPVPIPPTRRFM